MCGIAGILSPDLSRVDRAVIKRMMSAIRFRGRDDEGTWTDGQNIALLHSRLSIIDPAGGHQPMLHRSGRYVISFTGEIYNYVELRREYARDGARFRTDSDTEVLLEGFARFGDGLWSRLNGMFAVAIWDMKERRLVVARDHLGKKPMFWVVIGGSLYFASTLDAFRGIDGWSDELSDGAIATYALLGGFPEDATVYRAARRLPYATSAVVTPERLQPRPVRYWRMPFGKRSGRKVDVVEALDEYEEILTDAIRVRLRSDVPVALTFSGGVDSGTIAAIASRRLNTPLHCYTIDHDSSSEPSPEVDLARKVAGHLDLPWQFIEFDYRGRLLEELDEATAYFDEPCRDPALVYSYDLYRTIAPQATVVLSGNGADELFFGYRGNERLRREVLVLRLLNAAGISGMTQRLPKWADRMLAKVPRAGLLGSPYLRLPPYEAWARSISTGAAPWLSRQGAPDEIRALTGAVAREMEASGVRDRADLGLFLSLTLVTTDANFRIPDISGLTAQVEVRSPFLDTRMVEFAARLPLELKLGSFWSPDRNKHLPKLYYERHVPRPLVYSPKKGMGYNIRWDLAIASDPKWHARFDRAASALELRGIAAEPFRRAHRNYVRSTNAGRPDLGPGTLMTNGFMLGVWLDREAPSEDHGRTRLARTASA